MKRPWLLHDVADTTHNCCPTAICAALGCDERQVEQALMRHREAVPLFYKQRPRRGTGHRYSSFNVHEITPVLKLLGATIFEHDDEYGPGLRFPHWVVEHGSEAGVYGWIRWRYSPPRANPRVPRRRGYTRRPRSETNRLNQLQKTGSKDPAREMQ